ncbi:uncharacterized protein FFNC_10026 [Fusarium fujikuroi]|nr:uncharacterized protein FFE2_08895 [Fusarium fujikuroi]SCO07008.1 uncharacterized protein FFC1_10284 [Fusarium fujikuroi]SCO44763.1 uncharacterized protein FFNC_10026 [Fusarium fujikuroi]
MSKQNGAKDDPPPTPPPAPTPAPTPQPSPANGGNANGGNTSKDGDVEKIFEPVLYGPQILWLKDGGSIYVTENRLLICIVIPHLSEHQIADDECGYRGPTPETSLISQAGASSLDSDALPTVRVSITSPVSDGFAGRSFPDLEIGDVIILEAGERLLVDTGSICLISTLHITSSGAAGQGGWKEDAVKREKGNPPAV